MSVNQQKMVILIRDQFSKWASVIKVIPNIPGNLSLAVEDAKQKLNSAFVKAEDSLTKERNKTTSEKVSEVPQVINDLKLKLGQKKISSSEEKISWKSRKNVVSDLSITARTNYILNSVITAESDKCKLKRIEDLIEHFLQYPEGIGTAVKSGSISKLLKVKNNSNSPEIKAVLGEALAILGYVDPPPSQGIRILSIDGGGIRGLLVIEMLAKLEELTGKKIHELFDYICGVSTGSVIACAIGAGGKSLDEIAVLYKDLSNKIFSQNVFFGARSLIWNHGYYDTTQWEEILKHHVGELPLIKTVRRKGCPKVCMSLLKRTLLLVNFFL